ncbi:type II toxin-antitoxin system HicA family toxin [Microseira sp. BLCC-F43]|uniref:type II toxin-antitoxin system HicA family toxin n=1 Tax=Microseira sp. BLCC-F43 TaxID=3153602 RepID=UPI0035B7A33A
MSSRIRRMTAREVESILSQYGFQLISQKGSHRKWRNELLGLQVIVPEHRGKTLPIGTLRSIFQGAEISDSEWRT